MKKNLVTLLVFFLPIALACGNAMAAPIQVDGVFDTTEWSGNYADGDGVLTPGAGGQAFDVEYLGLQIEDNTVSFGLQTGFDVQDGVMYGGYLYQPGDFALDVDGDSVFDYGIDFTFTGNDVQFSLVDVTQWEHAMYPQHWAAADPFQVSQGGSQVNQSFAGAFGTIGNSYVLEGSFDLAYLAVGSLGDTATLHWTMECGNDFLQTSTAVPTPEPGTIFLMGLGLVGLASLRRKFS